MVKVKLTSYLVISACFILKVTLLPFRKDTFFPEGELGIVYRKVNRKYDNDDDIYIYIYIFFFFLFFRI